MGIIVLAGAAFFPLRSLLFKSKDQSTLVNKKEPEFTKLVLDLDTSRLTDKEACYRISNVVSHLLQEKGSELSLDQQRELRSIHDDCQLTIYSNVKSDGDKDELKNRVLKLLLEIEQ